MWGYNGCLVLSHVQSTTLIPVTDINLTHGKYSQGSSSPWHGLWYYWPGQWDYELFFTLYQLELELEMIHLNDQFSVGIPGEWNNTNVYYFQGHLILSAWVQKTKHYTDINTWHLHKYPLTHVFSLQYRDHLYDEMRDDSMTKLESSTANSVQVLGLSKMHQVPVSGPLYGCLILVSRGRSNAPSPRTQLSLMSWAFIIGAFSGADIF